MNGSSVNAGLVAAVFAPAPDDVPLYLIVTAEMIEAQVSAYERDDEGRVAAWRSVVDTVGEAHGGTPWEFTLHGGCFLRASHTFDGVPVKVWVSLRDPKAVAHLFPEGTES